MPVGSRIVAVLGPTNTGKTHRAVERMLEHESGIIGLPLRLLAREVFDRVSARVGRDAVALVTGEEKIVPRRPRYWVATVEAMPMGRDVDFVAVDEIQLAAHRERGHVFTDRLLHARGTHETWFLGSDTMKPLVRTLVPTAQIEEHPRLSSLTFAGATKLTRLPKRSAVVAFSMDRVYETAERLRAMRGGAAVVLGALSPRTRNAQVAMFQAGEVDTIVATDAIGMGLNLDVVHVAFAARHKFDGRELRELEEAELGQIAGRAGRYVTNGTFGTVAPLELPMTSVIAVESHRFPHVRRIRYRPHLLDFTSADALVQSLHVAPNRPGLLPVEAAEDELAFERLAAMPDVRRVITTEENVRLLWDVASIPDFRKLLFEAHVDDLREIFLELAAHGRVRSEFIARAVAPLASNVPHHDVETLLARITALRTWAYVANQDDWMNEGARWREETRALEETLSDALHAALTARFVSEPAKKTRAPRPKQQAARAPAADTDASTAALARAGHPFAKLRDVVPVDRPTQPALPEDEDFSELVDAPHDAFELAEDGTISARGVALARLARGPRASLPQVKMLDVEGVRPGLRSRLERRLLAYARDTASRLLAPIEPLRHSPSAPLRGLAHLLDEGLGTVLADEARELVLQLGAEDRALLDAQRIVVGTCSTHGSDLVKPRAIATRALLLRTAGRRVPAVASGATSLKRRGDDCVLVALGFVPLGPRAIRADVAERAAQALARGEDTNRIATWLGASKADAERVVRALSGFSSAREARRPRSREA